MTIKTISTSYFRTHLSQCVRETKEQGTIFIITRRGKPIARLKPLTPEQKERYWKQQEQKTSHE